MKCNPVKNISKDLIFMVDDYINKYRRYNKLTFRKYQSLENIEKAINNSALALDIKNQKSDHQYRIKIEALELSRKTLLHNKKKISSCKDFNSLLKLIETLLEDVKGLGELYYYDTSLKLGSYLKIFPDYIYLHRGTREGAKYLGLDYKKVYVNKSDLPNELQILEPYELEDFLCIYKNNFI